MTMNIKAFIIMKYHMKTQINLHIIIIVAKKPKNSEYILLRFKKTYQVITIVIDDSQINY